MNIALIAVPPLNTRFPALNIALLAGELKAHGHSAKCFDLNIEAFSNADAEGKKLWDFRNGHLWYDAQYFEHVIYARHLAPQMNGWLDRIMATEPDVVGISVTPNSFPRVLAKAIKARDRHVKIVVGGPTCSRVMGCDNYQPNEYIDAVASDESELSLLDLVERYQSGRKIVPVPGVTVLVEGEPKFGGTRPAIADLNKTAYPDFSDLDLVLYRDPDQTEPSRELPLYSSRGCVGRCSFCMDYKMWSVYYRQKSPGRLVDEMEHFWRTLGVKNFIFIELVFNGRHEWLAEFCAELKRRQLDFRFWSHGRIDGRLSLELLTALREVGFWQFMFGMESGSDKVLKLMRKGTTKAKAIANLRDCHKAGISASINVIVGYPGEDELDFLETLFFIVRYRKLIQMVPSITPCHATPGTDLYQDPQKFRIRLDRDCPRSWVSLDGKNTYRVRLRRARALELVCRHILFSSEQGAARGWRLFKDRCIGAAIGLAEGIYERFKLFYGSRRLLPSTAEKKSA